MVTPAHCRNYFKKSPFFLPGAAPEHPPRTLYTPSAQDWGCFSARQAVGIPFRAGNDTFFCPKCLLDAFRAGKDAFFCSESLWGTFRAGFAIFSCPAGGWKFQ